MAAESPLVIDSSSITFSKDGSNATTIEFSITDDFVGNENDKKIVLQLEYTGSPQFSNSVDIGGGSTYGSITITILDDDRKLCMCSKERKRSKLSSNYVISL